MNNEKGHFLVVFQTNTPISVPVDRVMISRIDSPLTVAQEAIRKTQLTTTRKLGPKTIRADVFSLSIKDGQIVKIRMASDIEVSLPFAPMTGEEFADEMNDIKKRIPPEFATMLCELTTDGCFEERVDKAAEIADKLSYSVTQYDARKAK